MDTVSYADVCSALKGIIPDGSVVLTHSSLKSFGYVEGGADTVIDALINICGAAGTLVVPTLTFKYVDESDPYFSVADTPSTCGIITETLLKRPDARRSAHVVSSAAAIGVHAEPITACHYDTPCGPGSPYMQVIDMKGYVLFLGATIASNTLFHCAEEAVNPPYMRYKTIAGVRVTDRGGVSTRDYRRYDCAQTGIIRRLDRMETIFRDNGAITDIKIGACNAMLIAARDNFSLCCGVLESRPGYILDEY